MLAYSTISHVGYVLLGILSGTAQGYQASMFYMISYVIVAAGAFGMVLLLARQGFEADKIVDFRGLNARSPWFAGMMAILMFSLAGLPPFIGFWAKLGVVQAVLGVGYTWLAVVAVLFSVVGAFFYLRIVKLMYFDEPTDATIIGGSVLVRTVLSVNALLAFGLGVSAMGLDSRLSAQTRLRAWGLANAIFLFCSRSFAGFPSAIRRRSVQQVPPAYCFRGESRTSHPASAARRPSLLNLPSPARENYQNYADSALN